MTIKITRCILLLIAAWLPVQRVIAVESTAPFVNPHLADSAVPETHAWSHATPLAGPTAPSHRLSEDEIQWKPLGPNNGLVTLYSSPYPNGKRVIWVGGYDRIAKLDADTLEVLTTLTIGEKTYYGEQAIERHLSNMGKLDYLEMLDYRFENLVDDSYASILTFYRLLSNKNEFYLPHRNADGAIFLRAYGEADANDPASKISLRREWKLPDEFEKAYIWGITMTHDGWIIIATADGKLIALSQDFSQHRILDLQAQHNDGKDSHYFASFLRNSPTTDDKGGIYVVTRQAMHRVQWMGDAFSMKESDGAWSANYSNELGIGSGTTPALMGWGDKEDHLVVIADATKGNNMMVLWRDEIPDDWEGLKGFDRRVAGITPVRFDVSDDEQPQVENSIVIHGYGAFIDNFDLTPEGLPNQKGNLPMRQALAGAIITNVPEYEPRGGTMIQWNPLTRKLGTAWTTQANFAMSVCTISRETEIIYCWGARDGEWTLEGTDWNTGESAFHYTLDNSERYNVWAGVINIAPNGAIDCGCHGGLGIVRIMPK